MVPHRYARQYAFLYPGLVTPLIFLAGKSRYEYNQKDERHGDGVADESVLGDFTVTIHHDQIQKVYQHYQQKQPLSFGEANHSRKFHCLH